MIVFFIIYILKRVIQHTFPARILQIHASMWRKLVCVNFAYASLNHMRGG